MTDAKLEKQIKEYIATNGIGPDLFIDAMCLYARIRKTKGREPYYNLDYISNKEIKTGKLHFGDITNHWHGQHPI